MHTRQLNMILKEEICEKFEFKNNDNVPGSSNSYNDTQIKISQSQTGMEYNHKEIKFRAKSATKKLATYATQGSKTVPPAETAGGTQHAKNTGTDVHMVQIGQTTTITMGQVMTTVDTLSEQEVNAHHGFGHMVKFGENDHYVASSDESASSNSNQDVNDQDAVQIVI